MGRGFLFFKKLNLKCEFLLCLAYFVEFCSGFFGEVGAIIALKIRLIIPPHPGPLPQGTRENFPAGAMETVYYGDFYL